MSPRTLFLLAMLSTTFPSAAVELAGASVADDIIIDDGRVRLQLNGAGIRSRFFVKLYVGALYLPQASHDAQAIAGNSGPVAVHMHVVYKEIPRAKLVAAWSNGFSANLSPAALAALQSRLQRFYELFPAVHRGDIVRLTYLPADGTSVAINDRQLGVIKGEDFMQALLQVWLGRHPADEDLKRGMLGLP